MKFGESIKMNADKTLKTGAEISPIECMYSTKTAWATARILLKGKSNFHKQYTQACCIKNNEWTEDQKQANYKNILEQKLWLPFIVQKFH